MRSMSVVNNNLHNEKDRNAILPTIGHPKETKQRERGKKEIEKEEKNPYKVEHETKSPAPKEAKASELHPWRLKLEIFPSRLPCGHPYRLEQRQNIAMNALPTARNFFHALFFTFAVYSPTFFGKSSSRVGPRTKIGRCVHRPVFGACTI